MGAWGSRAFDNDSARDWLAAVIEGTISVQSTLQAAIAADYLTTKMGEQTVAAAELVAASLVADAVGLPDRAKEWLLANRSMLSTPALRSAARSAVDVALDVSRSELAELWAETPHDDGWRESLAAIQRRL